MRAESQIDSLLRELRTKYAFREPTEEEKKQTEAIHKALADAGVEPRDVFFDGEGLCYVIAKDQRPPDLKELLALTLKAPLPVKLDVEPALRITWGDARR